MSPAPQPVPRGTRPNAWLRVLVLLLALLVPGAHAEAHTGAVAAVSGESTAVECDVLDTAPRPPARVVRRTAVPLRPALLTSPGPAYTARRAVPVPPGTPHALRPPRSEVLRC
ncbi:predicted protein [Streptomyces viridochromogenes DSM 40736]|uniref:Predicted protein n=1 Tax=Streptomyces viridochromogenes (strain DSM 40736 / JCM 4977 / BCRC 1201 / Tue 494) TaxID=591159 RepID=D9WYX1_STRVT|nr:hypothetical protein [Streptomyces viridochromogenes]EFL33250.1 predicted protein [Streptomyces viridochromogenes DSM 40736]